ncbi:MAG: (4Fe-4S)-binding protein [Deltaproteobacteria bacterium]|nr:(4Fe-4S)-binding protein [Deltaproteobacteria bacterium]
MNLEGQVAKRKVKRIKVNLDKCIGCRACEVACSGFHATPKFSSFNPARSRIRVVTDILNDQYVPIRSAEIAKAECDGRNRYTINDKEYSECSFCGAICQSRELFKEPDSGLPLKCDMCEDDPAVEVPWCVQVCRVDALTYEESEEEVEEEVKLGDMEVGLNSLVDKYGLQNLVTAVARMSRKD